jgi:hypothetical protein
MVWPKGIIQANESRLTSVQQRAQSVCPAFDRQCHWTCYRRAVALVKKRRVLSWTLLIAMEHGLAI